jgi:hypothetical protein
MAKSALFCGFGDSFERLYNIVTIGMIFVEKVAVFAISAAAFG